MSRFFKVKKEKNADEEEEDKDVEMPPMSRLMKLTTSEWPYLVTGSLFATIAGGYPVAFAVIMSELIKVILPTFKSLHLLRMP